MQSVGSSLSAQAFSVLHLLLETGERLPLLVESSTWIPPRLPMRWAVLERRYHAQSSTLAADLRVLGKLYTWAALQNINLDQYLGAGKVLKTRQINSLIQYYRQDLCSEMPAHAQAVADGSYFSPASFDHYLDITQSFLIWVLRTTYCPDQEQFYPFEELEGACNQIKYLFHSQLLKIPSSQRLPPLSDNEVDDIRKKIAPLKLETGPWSFPQTGFFPHTRLRNWLMFEMALGLGLRRGELLKLRLDGIPRGNHQHIEVVRLPDDPLDSRKRSPIPRALHAYLTLPPPLGRVARKSPYLFTTRNGDPVSIDTADDIIALIGKQSGIDLSWHRLRHTWAEGVAKALLSQQNGLDRLKYLGGWKSERSVLHYTQNTLLEETEKLLQQYQEGSEEE